MGGASVQPHPLLFLSNAPTSKCNWGSSTLQTFPRPGRKLRTLVSGAPLWSLSKEEKGRQYTGYLVRYDFRESSGKNTHGIICIRQGWGQRY